ncbi:unnamed protein product [Enterobius vermicularis]|uniref:ATP synthase subunit b n=1 Tax=Enterobius vermicularis TaxID=51028 RepID=A0A0N4UZ65_ENTVE|nr:unnamed protein product [Enterobius vermicularis]
MSLSRMNCMVGRPRVFVFSIQAVREASTARIPLKGELHPPRAFMQDVDKEFFAPESLPEMPKDYKEYPERDLKNFPYPTRRMYPPKSRLLMFPDSWFTPFYKLTGVSGPYIFFGGLFLFLVNKEIFVFDDAAAILGNWILWYLFISRSFGFKEHFPTALKEAMQLQLEATYRSNLMKTASEMKRRLDYLQETEAAQKRVERAYMLNWIIDSVHKEIEQNKDGIKDKYLNGCIDELKNLAAHAH